MKVVFSLRFQERNTSVLRPSEMMTGTGTQKRLSRCMRQSLEQLYNNWLLHNRSKHLKVFGT